MFQSPYTRKKRSKTKAAREIAADYLSSICLNGNVDTYLSQLESSSESVKAPAAFTASDELKLLVKLTSIASVVALPELLYAARQVQSVTYNATPVIAAGLIYLVLLWPLVRLLSRYERQAVMIR